MPTMIRAVPTTRTDRAQEVHLCVEAARILRARHVVPVHFEGWAHFTQSADTLVAAFSSAGLAERLHLLQPGGHFSL